MGALEGKPSPDSKDAWTDSGAETGQEFATRCMQWWNERIIPLSKASTDPKRPRRSDVNVLAVTHGAYINCLTRSVLAGARNYRGKDRLGLPVYNTSITVVSVDPGGRSGEILLGCNINHLLAPGTENNADDVLKDEDQAEKEVEVDSELP